MAEQLIHYRIFIASPGGLGEERNLFKEKIARFNEVHGIPSGVVFSAVGWEETLGGVGRPQEIINRELRLCDYAIFLWHDRWGSPPGGRSTSGTEEEWNVALEQYSKNRLRKICVFFKNVDPEKARDPGPQLSKVLAFRESLIVERKHMFHCYGMPSEFLEVLEAHLAQWIREHSRPPDISLANSLSIDVANSPEMATTAPQSQVREPSFNYWITEGRKLNKPNATSEELSAYLFCCEKALSVAKTKEERARALGERGAAQLQLKEPAKAIESFDMSMQHLEGATDRLLRRNIAGLLYNKGIAFVALGRLEDAIVAFDEIVQRFRKERSNMFLLVVSRAMVSTAGVRIH